VSCVLITTVKRGAPVEESGAAYIYDLEKNKVVCRCGMLPVQARIPRNPRGGIRGLRGACIDEVMRKIYITTNDSIVALDYDLNPLYVLHHPLFSNLHDVVQYKSSFIVASCGNDAIFMYCPDKPIEQLWGDLIDPNVNYALVDRHGDRRPNTLSLKGDDLYFTCANDRYIFKLNLVNKNLEKYPVNNLVSGHTAALHNAVLWDWGWGCNTILFNLSRESNLCARFDDGVETNVFHDKKPWYFRNTEIKRWGWLRGMDVMGSELLVVGSSPYGRILVFYTGKEPGKDKQIRLSRNPNEAVYSVNIFRNGI